jgi:hypothetical protein
VDDYRWLENWTIWRSKPGAMDRTRTRVKSSRRFLV